jgi:AraC-like DNA-binding protein
VLELFRHETAVALLTARRHSIAEVAFLLGFSEISAFYRAFRRRTGRAPAEFRDDLAE